MFVLGDAGNNVVNITDNGRGTVAATIDGHSATGRHINRVIVDTGAGTDQVSYRMTGALAGSETVLVDLGSGNDTATLDFSPGVRSGRLAVAVEGAGTPTGSVTLGSIAAGALAQVLVEANQGPGNLSVTFDGRLDGSLSVHADGGDGNDTLAVNATVAGGSTGSLRALVEGNGGTNNLTLNVFDHTAVHGHTGLALLDARIQAQPGDTLTHTSNVLVQYD
jgi:hypothetical protein